MKRRTQIALLCIGVAVLLCGLYAARMLHRGFGTRTAPSGAEAALAMSMRDMAIPSRYKAMTNPVTATSETVQEGMAHWADHCASCHANNGGGDTMYGRTMYPRPPDMRRIATQEMSDGELYYTINHGIRMSGMPAFGDPGDNDLESWKLVAFIRHLPKLTEQEELDMERMNPKSPEEVREEMDEEQFLNGGAAAPPQPQHKHHEP